MRWEEMFNEKRYLKMTAVYLCCLTDKPTINGYPTGIRKSLMNDDCT
jgi:hypothetical protein